MKIVEIRKYNDPALAKTFEVQVLENGSILAPVWVQSDPKDWVEIKDN